MGVPETAKPLVGAQLLAAVNKPPCVAWSPHSSVSTICLWGRIFSWWLILMAAVAGLTITLVKRFSSSDWLEGDSRVSGVIHSFRWVASPWPRKRVLHEAFTNNTSYRRAIILLNLFSLSRRV